ncbi:hypothetical protein JQN58_24155 [Aneurinibacillus sp. BA2021]|nr:hypothetical protein [Aneurinibacillus sp. BA2021]
MYRPDPSSAPSRASWTKPSPATAASGSLTIWSRYSHNESCASSTDSARLSLTSVPMLGAHPVSAPTMTTSAAAATRPAWEDMARP